MAITMVSVGFGNIISENVQGAFIQSLSNNGLSATFVAYDTAWNDAGTMAVVVGYDTNNSYSNAYAYYPGNDTYWPIDNAGFNDQRLYAADYFNQPIYDWPDVLLVDADYDENNLIGFYEGVFASCQAYTDTWEVWDSGGVLDGKPTASDMAPYDLVVWIPSRLMSGAGGARDALNYTDQAEIMTYLDGGGNFFLANNYFFNDYDNMYDFCTNYLGIGSVYSYYSSHGNNTRPIPGDAVFGDLPTMNQDWNNYGWTGTISGVDIFRGNPGTICLESDDGAAYYEDTGIRYDSGTFKTMFFSNPPLETLYLEDATLLMQTALDWYCPTTNGIIDQSNEDMGNSGYQHVNDYGTWAQSFIPVANSMAGVEFYMYSDYINASDYFQIQIFDDYLGEPGTVMSAEGWLYQENIPKGLGSADWVYCDFGSEANITSGQTYWIVCTLYNSSWNQYWLGDYNNSYSSGMAKKNYNGTWENLTFDWLFRTYSSSSGGSGDSTITGYEDVFWIAGDTYGLTPPATAYKVEPLNGLELIPMNDATTGEYKSVAVDDSGNPLFGGYLLSYMYYYDGDYWVTIPDDMNKLANYSIESMDFNPNDGRFYAGGLYEIFYTDPVPFTSGSSKCHMFNNSFGNGNNIKSIAWNEYYDYGLVAEGPELFKIWPYGHYGDGKLRFETVYNDVAYHFSDISWDTDGWNEAGIVGQSTMYPAYWRYYHSNPQLLEGYIDFGTAGVFNTCAFKPPSSPKWLFIPSGDGSVKVNTEEVDESGEITVGVDQPHIFTVDMWKQSDVARTSVLNTQVDIGTTYTFFLEGNYTIGGVDHWNDLQLNFTAWWDTGPAESHDPGDTTWTREDNRTKQFYITYHVASAASTLQYPTPSGGVPNEFVIDSVWQDTMNYGADNSRYRLYVNVTFGKQTYAASSSFIKGAAGNPWDPNSAFNDDDSWNFNMTIFSTASYSSRNSSYEEFGVNEYASISVSGNPGGSAPPGTSGMALSTPSQIYYSSNSQYNLNVSIPHLYLNGNASSSDWIDASYVEVQNTHPGATTSNSDIANRVSFTGPNSDLGVWGQVAGTMINPVYNGTQSAGPGYSDFTADSKSLVFEETGVYWWVTIPAGQPEGSYTATITITLWH